MAASKIQWQRDGFGNGVYANIAGANNIAYVLVDADDGCHVRCQVTSSNATGSTTSTSNLVGLIVEPAPTNSVVPGVFGTVQVQQTLTSSPGTWVGMGGHGATFTYQWQDSVTGSGGWSNIVGATTSSYTINTLEVGLFLRVVVTATNDTGSASASAPSTAAVAPPPSALYTESNVAGPVTGAPTVYTESDGVGPVTLPPGQTAPVNQTPPVVTGAAVPGHNLTCTQGTWDDPEVITFQWQSTLDHSTWTNLLSTASTYTVLYADERHYLRCLVTDTNTFAATSVASNEKLVRSLYLAPVIPGMSVYPSSSTFPGPSTFPGAGLTLTPESAI